MLGAFWFACLIGFLAWGPNRGLYVGAFLVVGYLELVGTALGTWAWAPHDPVLHVIGQGIRRRAPPGGTGGSTSGALLLAPKLLSPGSGCRQCLEETADGGQAAVGRPPHCVVPAVRGDRRRRWPSSPSSEVNRPPASTTTGTSAAMS